MGTEETEELRERMRLGDAGLSSEVRVNRTGDAAHGKRQARRETRNDQSIVAA
jgi:hypothetical protein